MSTNNLISIVIITCNRKKELQKAIQSCIMFADMNCEIIIVDNNSDDNTKKMLNDLQSPPHVQIRPFFLSSNLGVAGARNLGFSKANSKVVFFLDDDAYFAHDSEGLNYAYNYMLNNNHLFALATEINDLKKKRFLLETKDKTNPDQVIMFIGASHLLRKDYVKTQDLYPKNLFYGTEELYACLCAYQNGYFVEYNTQLKIIHNPSIFTRANSNENKRNIYVNKFVIKKLTLPWLVLGLSNFLFYKRLLAFTNYNAKEYYTCYTLYKKRFKENKYAIYRMSLKTLATLIKRFGFRRML